MSVSRETPGAEAGPSDSTVSRETETAQRRPSPLAALILLPIRGYRRFISPGISPRCRYYPSCSSYAEQSIRELGAIRGFILAAWRVMRCNPLSKGGVDHVSDRRLFRDRPAGHHVHSHGTGADPA